MPRASRTGVPSTEKPIASEWMMSRSAGLGRQVDVLLHATHVALADLVVADGDVEALVVRGGRAAAHADDDLAHVLAAHLLRGRHGRGDRAVAASMSTMLPDRMPWAG